MPITDRNHTIHVVLIPRLHVLTACGNVHFPGPPAPLRLDGYKNVDDGVFAVASIIMRVYAPVAEP